MRANGVRSLDVSCWQCHHRTILSADPWPDESTAPSASSTRAPLLMRQANHAGHVDPRAVAVDRGPRRAINPSARRRWPWSTAETGSRVTKLF
jgi:hypothetical protein